MLPVEDGLPTVDITWPGFKVMTDKFVQTGAFSQKSYFVPHRLWAVVDLALKKGVCNYMSECHVRLCHH